MGGWLGWQLLRQNGRILLRLDEMEQRLDELQFGGAEEPAGLPLGNEAPEFELPDFNGERKSLGQYRGEPVLLIFFNPACGFCRELAPKLAALASRSRRGNEADASGSKLERRDATSGDRLLTSAATNESALLLIIISTGGAEANHQLFDQHKLDCPVLLQKASEVAAAYHANGTPSGYLINPKGMIGSELAMGADAILALAKSFRRSRREEAHSEATALRSANPEIDQSLLTSAPTEIAGNGHRQDRFKNDSLVRSKIKRDGLKAGTPAPDFRLPLLDGSGELALSELRGRRVLLVFSSPGCGPCNRLAPQLEKFHREQQLLEAGRVNPGQLDGSFRNGAHGVTRPTLAPSPIAVVMISKGEPKENRAKVKEHGLTFPIVLQQQWEISRGYAMFATPVAYLIDEAGVIVHEVAAGSDAILALLAGLSGRINHGAQESGVVAQVHA